ncbi:Dehydroquinate synthase-like protein [Mytilinidion resinicola]|uniref:Dehydroquinate synthase-like protein n=1 Tax=Mytilinidion resinicola TaxID=574789 RepID=A0A6A6YAS5_9PEZI|nr:Dehydroquinate synthase-like protein [Mytilinidion resinicola]KAF2805719.1 Dehydroquinate synthase-like protein [Mytilinidion resinicola]
MTESTTSPLSGLYTPTQLARLYYGPGSVAKHLLSTLPSPTSKAFIITGNSLATKTPLVKDVEQLLSPTHHAGTFSNIREHAPIAQLDEATELVAKDSTIDTVISIGGGSPIDSAKAISHRTHARTGKWLFHIAIPTTLSAGECTYAAGYTESSGVKTGVSDVHLAPSVVIYDASFAQHTPPTLFLSTGLRALDHAVELLYHETISEVPGRVMCLNAAAALFKGLPLYKHDPGDVDTITRLQLAAFESLGFRGTNVKGGIGLSHSLGYALGSPYGIPHGITSCLTLGHVVKLKAGDPAAAREVARVLPFVGGVASGDERRDAEEVGERILDLVRGLGLKKTLGEYGVGEDQVGVIVKRATGGLEEGEVFDRVAQLVRGLW